MPLVSIVIINYNTFELTSKCIDSILFFTKEIDFEIILVDNDSKECSPKKFKEKFPEIILVESFENVGFSKGNNIGISHAKGEYILLLNSDTELINNAIKIVCDFLDKNQTIGAATSKLIYPNGKVQHCCQSFPSVWLRVLEFSRIHKLFPKNYVAKLFLGSYFDHESYVEPDWIWGTFFMFPKKILKELENQKLNDDYFMYVEDMQWCFDFQKLMYKIAYIPEAHTIHFVGGSPKNENGMINQNQLCFLRKNYSYLHYSLLKLFYNYSTI